MTWGQQWTILASDILEELLSKCKSPSRAWNVEFAFQKEELGFTSISSTVTTQSKSPVKYLEELGEMPAEDLHTRIEGRLNISLTQNSDAQILTCSV